jgi:hypothetical protein
MVEGDHTNTSPGLRTGDERHQRGDLIRTLISNMRSISPSVVSSNVFGMAVPALFTGTSSPPNAATVFSTAPLMASASAASAWIAIAFPPM